MTRVRTTPQAKATVAQLAEPNPDGFTARDWLLFISVSLIWGSSFLFIAEALDDGVTPGVISFGRVALGAVTLWGFQLVGERPLPNVGREDWLRIVLLAVVWVAIPFTLFPLAQQWINSAVSGLLNGATPICVAIISVLLTRRIPRGLQRLGIAAGFIGIVLLSLPSITEGSTQARGVLLVLAATICYGIAINVAAPLQQRYGSVALMTMILTIATVALIPVFMRDLNDSQWTASGIGSLFTLGALCTGLAYWIMATLVGRVGPIRASFITYLIPVVALALGVVLRNDAVSALGLVGAAIVVAGALVASRAD